MCGVRWRLTISNWRTNFVDTFLYSQSIFSTADLNIPLDNNKTQYIHECVFESSAISLIRLSVLGLMLYCFNQLYVMLC